MDDDLPPQEKKNSALKFLGAIALAAAFTLGIYALLEATQPVNGLVSFAFLLCLPAAICAFLSYMADLDGSARLRRYLLVPVWVLLAAILVSLIFLREGTLCVLLLAPLWLISGMIGAGLTYIFRKRLRDKGSSYCLAILALPLLAIQIEPAIPLPQDMGSVTRSITIAAPPQTIWPLLRGIPDVRPGEGRWNISQNLIGIPRPLSAKLVGSGIGADRYAQWGDHIDFRERIIRWEADHVIAWRFIFDDLRGWAYTDRHLLPNSAYFRVMDGGYSMQPTSHGMTKVTITTRYRIRTPVNAYSTLWGELFLGDLENNLLGMIKDRAERDHKL